MSYNPTEEQQAYIDAAGRGNNIVLKARAGCGKTATACLLGNALPNKKIRIAVFNNKNAQEMQEKLPSNMLGSTFHKMCGSWFGFKRPKLKAGEQFKGHKEKVPSLILDNIGEYDYRIIPRDDPENGTMYDNVIALSSLVSLMKNTFIEYPNIEQVKELAEFHQIQFIDNPDEFAKNAIKILKISDYSREFMDFDDMIRFHVIDEKVKPECDLFIGDEIQDSTPLRIRLMELFAKQGVECHAPGDDWQGIYVFTGAALDSVDQVTQHLNAIIMPLTINFRCSKRVIEEAQKIVPDIKYWNGAPDGLVETIQYERFSSTMKPGDCAIARFNKVIIPKVFSLLREGKKATIQGADFGRSLVRTIKSVKATTMEEFNLRLAKMRERDMDKAQTELGKQIIDDKYSTIGYFADNSDTVEKMITLVTSLFSDKSIGEYKFSTAHRAKGLEWENVFILNANNFYAPQAKQGWQQICERRLEYVAKTRAKLNMYYVI